LICINVGLGANCYRLTVRDSLQDLIRLLAHYRRRLESGENPNPAALLRALIAEIEAAPPAAGPPSEAPAKPARATR